MGKGFLDNNEYEVESIQMNRFHNSELMTTNQVLTATQAHHYIVKNVYQRS